MTRLGKYSILVLVALLATLSLVRCGYGGVGAGGYLDPFGDPFYDEDYGYYDDDYYYDDFDDYY